MSTIVFEIRYEDGRRETAAVEGERALVGSASHCDVRLPMGDAADEHLLVELVGDTLYARALNEDAPVLLDGVPLAHAVLPDRALLGIGRLRLLVKAEIERTQARERAGKSRGHRSELAGLGLLLLAGIGVALSSFDRDDAIAPAPARAPELFSEQAPACPKAANAGALAFAEEQEDMAVATHERVPFAAHEGVVAVGLYRSAAACFRVAGATGRAEDAEQTAETLMSALGDDFRARRLRLSHVLALEDYELAKTDVTVLRALTAGKKGAYVEWLKKVDKQLEAKGER